MRFNEGIDIKIVYCDDTPSEYIDDVTMNDIYDILDSSSDICKIVDVSGSKKKVVWTDEYGFERAYESKKSARKSIKESVRPEIQRMVNRIIDDLIGEYSSKEWDRLSDDEKFDIIENKYDFYYEFYFNKKNSKDLLEIEDLVIENMNHPFNVVFESKKSMKKSLKESKDSDFFNGIAKEYHFSKDEKTRYKNKTHISAIGVLFDRINDAIKIYGRNSDEEYNALNDCWSVITSAKQNGWNVDYEEDKWNKIAGLPNYH